MCKKYGNNYKEIVHKWHKLEIRGEIYDKSLFKVDEVFKDLITLGRELNPDFWVILYVALCHGMIMCLIYVIESSRMLLYYSSVDFVLAAIMFYHHFLFCHFIYGIHIYYGMTPLYITNPLYLLQKRAFRLIANFQSVPRHLVST